MADFLKRLDKFMKYKGLNDNQITVEAGISNGLIGKARKRGTLSHDNISKILHTYPELNAHWWFTGKGEMLLVEEGYEMTENSLKLAEDNAVYNKLNVLKELFGYNDSLYTKLDMIISQNKKIIDRMDRSILKDSIENELKQLEKKEKLKS